MCLVRMFFEKGLILRTKFSFLHLSAARNGLEHATCVKRAHHIREPPPHPTNFYKAYFSCVNLLVPCHRVLSVSFCGSGVHNVYLNGNGGDTLPNRELKLN